MYEFMTSLRAAACLSICLSVVACAIDDEGSGSVGDNLFRGNPDGAAGSAGPGDATHDGRPQNNDDTGNGVDESHPNSPVPSGTANGGGGECVVTRCEAGILEFCDDDEFAVDCAQMGAHCVDAQFETDAGIETAPWCSCGDIPEGYGVCADDMLVACEGGLPAFYDCIEGTFCGEDELGLGCLCDNAPDGVCPDSVCVDDPDCSSCLPSCGARECGDNGCGGECGTCAPGETCGGGYCESTVCVPSCRLGGCGLGDGCGGTCGCDAGETCDGAGFCVEDTCTAYCAPGRCGMGDGCGGTCGCGNDESCTDAGFCEEEVCVPDCSEGRVCDYDGCGNLCGTCGEGEECIDPAGGSPARYCGCFFGSEEIQLDGTQAGLSSVGATMRYVAVKYRSHHTTDGRTDSQREWRWAYLFADEPTKTLRLSQVCTPDVELEVFFERATGSVLCHIGPQVFTGQTSIVFPNIDEGCPDSL